MTTDNNVGDDLEKIKTPEDLEGYESIYDKKHDKATISIGGSYLQTENNSHSEVRTNFVKSAFLLFRIIAGLFIAVTVANVYSIITGFHPDQYDIIYRVGILFVNGTVVVCLSNLILGTKKGFKKEKVNGGIVAFFSRVILKRKDD